MTKGAIQMDKITTFANDQFGSIRTVLIDGIPYFAGKDVAEMLGYERPTKATVDRVDEDDRVMIDAKAQSQLGLDLGQRGGWIINESGLYSLIFSSKLPTAKEVKTWITSEVLPAARKFPIQSGGITKTPELVQKDDEINNIMPANNGFVAINGCQLSVKEYHRQRVVTFRDIDEIHRRPEGTARKRFNDNRQYFNEGEDFFVLNQPSEIRTLGLERPQGGTSPNVILVTESGYAMLVKSFTDPLSWAIQRKLVDTYFHVAERKYNLATLDELFDDPDVLITALVKLKAERQRNKALQQSVEAKETQIAVQTRQLEEAKPKVTYYDIVLNCKDLIFTSVIAKDYGKSAIWLNRYLSEKKVQYKKGNAHKAAPFKASPLSQKAATLC